jgi:beta-phosphoglucomutase-like phosphatase (HAD superfamily)
MSGAILLDFNGVLVDDEELHRIALTRVLEGLGLPLSPEDCYAHYLGIDDPVCFAEAFRRFNRNLPATLLRHLVAEKQVIDRELIDRELPFIPGAVEVARAEIDLAPEAVAAWPSFAGRRPAVLRALVLS